MLLVGVEEVLVGQADVHVLEVPVVVAVFTRRPASSCSGTCGCRPSSASSPLPILCSAGPSSRAGRQGDAVDEQADAMAERKCSRWSASCRVRCPCPCDRRPSAQRRRPATAAPRRTLSKEHPVAPHVLGRAQHHAGRRPRRAQVEQLHVGMRISDHSPSLRTWSSAVMGMRQEGRALRVSARNSHRTQARSGAGTARRTSPRRGSRESSRRG